MGAKTRAEQKDLKKFQSGQKRSIRKVGAKGDVVAEEISAITKNLSILNGDKKEGKSREN